MTDQLTRLAKPFSQRLVNPPPKGKYGSSVAHPVVVQRLLAVCGGYDFTVKEIIYGPSGLVEGIVASMTLTYDGKTYTIDEMGDVEFPEQKTTQGQRLKDAASDAIKRCAMRFGVALDLWAGDQFFLFDMLEKRDGAVLKAPLISSNRREHINARILALGAAKTSVADARSERDLPPVDKSTPEELTAWEQLLTELEAQLEAPFVEAEA